MSITRLNQAFDGLLDSRHGKFHGLRIASALILTLVFIVSYVGIALAVIATAAVFFVARCIDSGWRTVRSDRSRTS